MKYKRKLRGPLPQRKRRRTKKFPKKEPSDYSDGSLTSFSKDVGSSEEDPRYPSEEGYHSSDPNSKEFVDTSDFSDVSEFSDNYLNEGLTESDFSDYERKSKKGAFLGTHYDRNFDRRPRPKRPGKKRKRKVYARRSPIQRLLRCALHVCRELPKRRVKPYFAKARWIYNDKFGSLTDSQQLRVSIDRFITMVQGHISYSLSERTKLALQQANSRPNRRLLPLSINIFADIRKYCLGLSALRTHVRSTSAVFPRPRSKRALHRAKARGISTGF